jgi:hypothetical protein
MLPRKLKLKSLPYLNMFLPIGDIHLKEVRALLFARMLILNLQRLLRSIPTKEVCLPAIIVAPTVTFDLIVHRSMLRSPRSRSKSQRKVNLVLDFPSLIMLPDKSNNTPREFLPRAITVARLATPRPTISS